MDVDKKKKRRSSSEKRRRSRDGSGSTKTTSSRESRDKLKSKSSRESRSSQEKKRSKSQKRKKKEEQQKAAMEERNEHSEDDEEQTKSTEGTRTVLESMRGFSLSETIEDLARNALWNALESKRLSSAINLLSGVSLRQHVKDSTLVDHEQQDGEDEAEGNGILQVRVLRANGLHGDGWIKHPVVRVSIVDTSTGKYYPKATQREAAVNHKEFSSKAGATVATPADEELQHRRIYSCRRETIPTRCIPSQVTEPCKGGSAASDLFHADWTSQEPLLFNVPVSHLMSPDAALFFEVLDFGPSIETDILQQGGGFYPIAWGFLKLVNSQGGPNFGTTVSNVSELNPIRLQLFRYPANTWAMRTVSDMLEKRVGPGNGPRVFHAFLLKNRERYPSSLEVCISATEKPKQVSVQRRPLHALEKEVGDLNAEELISRSLMGQLAGEESEKTSSEGAISAARRHRMRHEPCIIPTNLLGRLPTGSQGCFDVQFSPDGQFLAAACCEGRTFPIKVFETNTLKLRHTLLGHQSLVYELSWQKVDEESPDECLHLVSAAADGTARVWSIPNIAARALNDLDETDSTRNGKENNQSSDDEDDDPQVNSSDESDAGDSRKRKKNKRRNKKRDKRKGRSEGTNSSFAASCELVLQHAPPTYIYSAQFHPTATDPPVIATASYDGFVRLWDGSTGRILGKTGKLDYGRAHHKSNVNSLCFTTDGNRLISGDADGVVIVWRLETGRQPSNPDAWHVARKIEDPDLKGRSITTVQVHPIERLLLVAAQQNVIRLFELRRYTKQHEGFIGAPVSRSLIRASFSPDGNFVLSGSESGKPFLWQTSSGVPSGSRWKYGFPKPLCSMSWHPSQHLVALCSFNGNSPILLYEALRDTRDVNAKPVKSAEEAEKVEEEHEEELMHKTLQVFQNNLGSKSTKAFPTTPSSTLSRTLSKRKNFAGLFSSDEEEDGEETRTRSTSVEEQPKSTNPTTPISQVKGINSLRERLARLRSQSASQERQSLASSNNSASESDDEL